MTEFKKDRIIFLTGFAGILLNTGLSILCTGITHSSYYGIFIPLIIIVIYYFVAEYTKPVCFFVPVLLIIATSVTIAIIHLKSIYSL